MKYGYNWWKFSGIPDYMEVRETHIDLEWDVMIFDISELMHASSWDKEIDTIEIYIM